MKIKQLFLCLLFLQTTISFAAGGTPPPPAPPPPPGAPIDTNIYVITLLMIVYMVYFLTKRANIRNKQL